jgi:oligopeptide/dipeptide ABC transporter ATP-binding protein
MTGPILSVQDLRKHFGALRALDGVSFDVAEGETLGLVGESGCGKTTLGKTLIRIYQPSGGRVLFQGQEIGGLSTKAFRKVRKALQYVYQDPGASLDPRWKIGRSLHEPLVIHYPALGRAERQERVLRILEAVGLHPEHLDLYPHELSGGQQRRVGLARVLTLRPSLVILDEPTSGLDVSVQATILKLFLRLREEFGLTCLFISHDLSVVRMMCSRVAVMYLGRIVEMGDTAAVFDAPQHPYTRSLLAAVPQPGGRRITDDFSLEGEPPNPIDLPSGCRFRTRCPMAAALCATDDPALTPRGPTRQVACHMV